MRSSLYLAAIAGDAVVLLLIAFALTACATIRSPSTPGGTVLTAVPTPAIEPTRLTTSQSAPPDPRIAELRALGISLSNLFCDSKCAGDVSPQVQLDKFIATVGAPDKVGSSLYNPVNFVAILIYGERGMVVYAQRPYAEDAVNMTPTMRVTQIFLYRARTLKELETETRTPYQKAQDWSGFGPIRRLPNY